MLHRVTLLICAAALTLLQTSSRAAADDWDDDDIDDVRIYGGLGLGFGGTAEIDANGPFGLGEAGGEDDLVTSIGGQVGFDIPVMRYLSLGGEARLLTFNTDGFDDNDVDRSKLLDIDFKPRVRFPIHKTRLELYAALPVGITVPFLADDFGDDDNLDGKVGWNLGIGAGLNYWITRGFALNVEPMYVMHWFDLDGRAGSSADVALRQFTIFVNGVVAL
jgi:hypothetical protein